MANNAIIQDINDILAKHSIEQRIGLTDVTITDKTISDLCKQNPILSNALTDHLWPSLDSADVYHYTDRKFAESILNTGIFRLTNIAKRYTEGEIETFCKTHNLQGYLEQDINGDPKYKHLLMPNIFYASFTDTSISEEQENYFWRNFASCDGVRLKMKVTASNPNFRKIRYEKKKGKPIPILHDLVNQIRINHKREFILKGISRLSAFYLSGDDYDIENEYRALYKYWAGFDPQPQGTGATSYVELPLGSMNESGYQFDITEVHAVEKPQMPTSYTFSKRII